jgi:predicted DNA-binding transcriptional regulator AlpA
MRLGCDREGRARFAALSQSLDAMMDTAKLFAQGNNNRIARLPEACLILGLSPSSIRNRLAEGGRWADKDFPKPVRLGAGRRCAIGWPIGELLAYVELKRAKPS